MGLLAALAVAAAVAAGDLAVTTSPSHPVAGHPVRVDATGQVGDTGGWLYVYRNSTGRSCADMADGERSRRGRLLRPPLKIDGMFEMHVSYVPRRAGREWICSYLYAITCDLMRHTCGAFTGIPPDAGWFTNPIRVRPRR